MKNMHPMRIEPLEKADIPDVISLWERAGLARPWNDPCRDAEFARGKTNSDILIGRRDGAIIASVMVGHDGHRGAMYYLAVCPKHQGCGYGREIVKAAEAWLCERGVWKINLLVRDDNQSVLAFYSKLGYEPGGTIQLGRRFDPVS
jgi:ribosomal protein S18 acetylase RimI-like enzyme